MSQMYSPLTPSQIRIRLRDSVLSTEIPDEATGGPSRSHSYYTECDHIFSLGALKKRTGSQTTNSDM